MTVTHTREQEASVADELRSGDSGEDSGTAFEVGDPIKSVNINIDYAIIKHFSEHLYSSPNKAIEELVSNGFDALATRCYVYVPGSHVADRVIVWDDGTSMNADGIQAMWQIAKSPKEDLGADRVIRADGRQRAVIGKFGIGKLASYAVGHRISHICLTANGTYLSVSVNYRQFAETVPTRPDSTSDTQQSSREDNSPARDAERDDAAEPSTTTIRELTMAQAETLARALLPNGDAADFMFKQKHWTLAVIDDLKPGKTLYPGRLSWVLGNGMPLRPDFRVWVEDEEVTPKLASNASTVWDLGEPAIQSALKTSWGEALDKSRVEGSIDFDPDAAAPESYETTEPDATAPAVLFPTLGRVTATVRIFEDSLNIHENEGRSHGFFLMVRGRLVNPDDDKLLLNDPSFGTFYRSQFILNANGLDAELLSDRESLRRDTPMTRELQALQTALYRTARTEVNRGDEVKEKSVKPESRLPVRSRELFRDPMAALFSRAETKPTSMDLDEPKIDRKALGEAQPLAELEKTSGHLQVNSNHPFYQVVEDQAGGGKKGAAVMRAFDLFAVAERLTEGFLYGRGFSDDQVQDVLEWRDRLFRSLAAGYGRNPEDVLLELKASSIAGDRRFENAITAVFEQMGFNATRDGLPGQKDVAVIAPVGPNHRVFIVEAKGSAGPVENVPAAVAAAASHRDKTPGATHAIIVAREFAGFQMKDDPAILEECRAVKGVSLVTVETLVKLYDALRRYAYPLEAIMDALFENESPLAKQERVTNLEKPLHSFNFGDVLNEIWERQQRESIRDLVPLRTLWQSKPQWRDEMDYSSFLSKMTALSHFAGHLMVLDLSTDNSVHITQHPEKVVEHVERALHPPLGAVLDEALTPAPDPV